jgi:ribose-phosphate pyrophosphokinase
MTPRNTDDILVFGGSASPGLARAICSELGSELGRSETIRFSEGNLFVRILENVRGRNVYLVQTTAFQPNDHFMELLFWIDAFKRASAERVTAIVPFFSYAKGDKKDEPRVSIRARVCADALEAIGVDRMVTVDLQPPQIQGFFKVPVDDLYAVPVLCDVVGACGLVDLVVVSPGLGFVKKARLYAKRLGTGLVILDKERKGHDERAEVVEVIGDVAGRNALLVDDFTASGGTLVAGAEALAGNGAKAVYAAVTHGVFGPRSMEAIDGSPIKLLFTTDTVENHPVELSDKVRTVSLAPLLAEGIRRIHNRESISGLFL